MSGADADKIIAAMESVGWKVVEIKQGKDWSGKDTPGLVVGIEPAGCSNGKCECRA